MKRFLDFRPARTFARRLTAGVAAFVIVLSQFAVAAHACLPPVPAPVKVAVSAHDCDSPSDGAGVAALCKQHCENGQQNVVKPFVLDIPVAIMVLTVPLAPALAIAQTAISPAYVAGAPPPSPPFLQSSILRI